MGGQRIILIDELSKSKSLWIIQRTTSIGVTEISKTIIIMNIIANNINNVKEISLINLMSMVGVMPALNINRPIKKADTNTPKNTLGNFLIIFFNIWLTFLKNIFSI